MSCKLIVKNDGDINLCKLQIKSYVEKIDELNKLEQIEYMAKACCIVLNHERAQKKSNCTLKVLCGK